MSARKKRTPENANPPPAEAAWPVLNRALLARLRTEEAVAAALRLPAPHTLEGPIRALQFGEGKFLRAFVDLFWQQANETGRALGRVAVVQPIPTGRCAELAAQDGLYTVALQGPVLPDTALPASFDEASLVDTAMVVGAVAESLSAYAHWKRVVALATDPALRFVISNTTEAGIATHPQDHPEAVPPPSFPAKVAVLLAERYRRLGRAKAPGLVFLPCELVADNGARLAACVAELAERWSWDDGLRDWALEQNVFANTLVDRIVSGFPAPEALCSWCDRLGFRDHLLDLAEPFGLWVIEGTPLFGDPLPPSPVDLDVRFVADAAPYRTRKVRLLNGAHTAVTALGMWAGLTTVREAIQDSELALFVQEMMDREIVGTLPGDRDEHLRFARRVRRRFDNPFMAHRLADIALNTSAKIGVRLVCSLRDYCRLHNRPPRRLCLAVAANLALFDPAQNPARSSSELCVTRETQAPQAVRDDSARAAKLREIWRRHPLDERAAADAAARALLGPGVLGEADLNTLAGVSENVAQALWLLATRDVGAALRWAGRR